MNVALSVKLPRELRDKAAAKSEETGISISFVVRKALEDWVNQVKEFIVCVQDPNFEKKGAILVHPIVRVFNGNPEKYTSPKDVIRSYEIEGIYGDNKILSISKSQVNEDKWNWLTSELRQPTERKVGIEIETEVLND